MRTDLVFAIYIFLGRQRQTPPDLYQWRVQCLGAALSMVFQCGQTRAAALLAARHMAPKMYFPAVQSGVL